MEFVYTILRLIIETVFYLLGIFAFLKYLRRS